MSEYKKEEWRVKQPAADIRALAERFSISPILAHIIVNREITEPDAVACYLSDDLAYTHDPALMKDMDKGCQIMKEKIRAGKKIRIISDYDVDGITSNYILYQGLQKAGADVSYDIPHRIMDGYGMNVRLVEAAYADGVDTIITCDNGIAAAEQIAYGNSLGLTLVVTDHHDIPFQRQEDGSISYNLPSAAAVINPKQKDCPYPFENICGAVVVYKFIQVLYDLFGIDRRESEAFLEIAAMATVCDVMPLCDENRIIVKEGLRRIQHTNITGLQALIEANHLEEKKISSYHFGFILGPCINASGRLTSAKDALELLLCEDKELCRQKAEALTQLNAERKEMTANGVKAAKEYLESTGHANDKVLVVYLPNCHESIAGIIAGRMKEHYHKPVFVITRTKEGLKGSGRSIEAYHMYKEMNKIKECFDKFGGHPMAAGFSMQEDRLEEFREKLNANATLTEDDFAEKVHIDVALPISYLSESLINEFELLEPFGNENTKPLFAQKDLYIKGMRVLGTTGRCLKLFLSDANGTSIDAMYFGESDVFLEELISFCGKEEAQRIQKGLSHHIWMDVTYYPQVNEWRGQKNIQIVIQNYRFKNL